MTPIPRVSAKKYRGLGDVVHAVAQPVAKGIDRILRTNIQGCRGCPGRRKWLNAQVPFGD